MINTLARATVLGQIMTLIMSFVSLPVSAQEITAAQRAACQGDFNKYCKGVTPGGGRIIACLNKESSNLTPACKTALTAAEKKK